MKQAPLFPDPETLAAPAQVIIVKKSQGSVWSEAGRTPLCPTLDWLLKHHGVGEYELRLRQGKRILCMAQAIVSG